MELQIIFLDVNIVGSISHLFFIIMLSVLMFLTLGFSIGSLAKTQESVGVIASIFIYPQIVMSGVFFPIEKPKVRNINTLSIIMKNKCEILPTIFTSKKKKAIPKITLN